ncbi:MAG TPA: hypothetical protein VMS01_17910 [Stellaceae bacterium]|nr:hypothetical protein [Stellaceae bacterium]
MPDIEAMLRVCASVNVTDSVAVKTTPEGEAVAASAGGPPPAAAMASMEKRARTASPKGRPRMERISPSFPVVRAAAQPRLWRQHANFFATEKTRTIALRQS